MDLLKELDAPSLAPSLLGTGVVLVVLYFLTVSIQNRIPPFDAPVVSHAKGFLAALQEGKAKYRNQPFILNTPHHPTVILPRKWWEELKSLPESHISFEAERLYRWGKGNPIALVDHVTIETTKNELTRHTARSFPLLLDETVYAVDKHIGPCVDWTPITVYPTDLQLIALLSSRTFVGLPLSRNERWLEIMIRYTILSKAAARALWPYPFLLRPILQRFAPQSKELEKQRKEASALVRPILEQRLADLKRPDFKPPNDMMQWVLHNCTPAEREDIDFLVQQQLTLSIVSIHTTAHNLTHCIFDLAAHPECIEPLRQEFLPLLRETNGQIDKQLLTKCNKLDSFCKESQRFCPPGLIVMSRKIMSDIPMSNGTILPKGLFVATSNYDATSDESVLGNPDQFDAFRYERMRLQPQQRNLHQLVSTSTSELSFGFGTHACPGRFFAAFEIKMILIYLLLNYDLKFQEGVPPPRNEILVTAVMPSFQGKVMMKRRREKIGWHVD
uniref:Cytochrome P450 n=1 Tax=Paecilomyces divaricatus TaxID=644132 RepID=A0A3G1IHI0_PAEDI|nr:cytochrome P450 [Paecilomyces divaricatus]